VAPKRDHSLAVALSLSLLFHGGTAALLLRYVRDPGSLAARTQHSRQVQTPAIVVDAPQLITRSTPEMKPPDTMAAPTPLSDKPAPPLTPQPPLALEPPLPPAPLLPRLAPEPPALLPRPDDPPPRPLAFGEADGRGKSLHSAPGEQPMQARQSEHDQAQLRSVITAKPGREDERRPGEPATPQAAKPAPATLQPPPAPTEAKAPALTAAAGAKLPHVTAPQPPTPPEATAAHVVSPTHTTLAEMNTAQVASPSEAKPPAPVMLAAVAPPAEREPRPSPALATGGRPLNPTEAPTSPGPAEASAQKTPAAKPPAAEPPPAPLPGPAPTLATAAAPPAAAAIAAKSALPIPQPSPAGEGGAAAPGALSESESDAFSTTGGATFRPGKIEARFGRKLKTVRPRLSLAAQNDLLGLARPEVTMQVRVDAAGRVREVKVTRSSGSSVVDHACELAMYEWWFEPPRDQSGKALPSELTWTFTWRW
jgi:TonB family protein